MKSTVLRDLSLLTVASIGLFSCNPLSKMAKNADKLQYTVTPNPLEMHGDSVNIAVNGNIPPKYFHKKATATLKPYFKVGDNVVAQFDSINLVGSSADGDGKKIDYEKGGSYKLESKVPYTPEMVRGELWVTAIGKYKGKVKDIVDIKLADGTITTPLMVAADDKPILGKDNFKRITTDVHAAQINYLINSSEVRSTELRNEAIKEMMDAIKAKSKDAVYQFKSLYVEAYASPDGEITRNEKLADNRAESASAVVKRQLSSNKVKAASDKEFTKLEGKGEDWEGFKTAMQASDIKDKDLIIRVLQMYPDPAKREEEIKNLAETYIEVKDRILPGLRRSQIKLSIDKVGKSDEEISALASSDAKALNVEELLYAATLTNDINKQLEIYRSAVQVYPNDWRAHNNVGYILVLQNKLDEAETNFKNAESKAANKAEVMNNLGVIARLRGNRAQAMEYYKKASGAGDEVNYNMGILNILSGNYSTAESNFGGTKSFNAALAQLLNGDANKAISTLDASEEKNSAEAYYLKAIAGARNNNLDMVMNNLKAAISKDPALKDKAKKDAEFIKFNLSSL